MTPHGGAWLAPQLDSLAASAELATRLRTSPLRLVVVDQFLRPDRASVLRQAVAEHSEYRSYERLSSKLLVDPSIATDSTGEASWQEWSGVPDEDAMSPSVLQLLLFGAWRQSSAFCAWVSRAAGIELRPANRVDINQLSAGDYLSFHSDEVGKHRFGIVLFLVDDWREEFGGVFEATGTDGSTIAVLPNHNRAILFDPHGQLGHRVTEVADAASCRRYSIVLWFEARTD